MDIILFNQYFDNSYAIVPINLICLATYLKSKGINCKIYELGLHRKDKPKNTRYGLNDEQIKTIIKKENPKIIGISCMYTRHYKEYLELSNLIKKTNNNIKIVVGGNHASTNNIENADFIVKGEGEKAFYDICRGAVKNRTTQYELTKNLDEFPVPDYSFINIQDYLDDTFISPFLMRPPSFGVISSRGCPGNCIFCTVQGVWGRTWRGRSPEHFIAEIKNLIKNYAIKEFSFLDDSISLDRKRWIKICELLKPLDIKWTVPNGIAHWTINEEIIKLMKEAGCYRITFGIESGNQATRNFIRKNYDLTQAKRLIRYANDIGMWTTSTNILGFPYETPEQIKDTIKFAKKTVDFAGFYLLSPVPKSEVYQYFEGQDGMREEGLNTYFIDNLSLRKIQKKAYHSFMLFRALTFIFTLRLVRKIHNKEDFLFVLKIIKAGFRIAWKSLFMKNTLSMLYD